MIKTPNWRSGESRTGVVDLLCFFVMLYFFFGIFPCLDVDFLLFYLFDSTCGELVCIFFF